jgi:DNA-binding transcriptional LysR family regulator
MKFDLADLRAFLAVADLGSFRAASLALNLSQSALSRRIDKLEHARNVISELENALIGIQDVAERMSGHVVVACVPSAVAYFLPAAMREYRRQYPRIRLSIVDESSSVVLTTVARGDADFGVTYIGTQDADVEFQPLLEEPFVLAVPHSHPLARRRSVAWKELAGHEYISLAQGSGNRFLIDQALAHSETRPRWSFEVQHVPALVSMVEAGLGIGVVPRLAMPPPGHKSLVGVSLTDPVVRRTLGLIHRRGRPLSPVARLLWDLLVRMYGQPALPGRGDEAGRAEIRKM